MRYPPSGYIIFSLRKLKFYGGRDRILRPGVEGWLTQTPTAG